MAGYFERQVQSHQMEKGYSFQAESHGNEVCNILGQSNKFCVLQQGCGLMNVQEGERILERKACGKS